MVAAIKNYVYETREQEMVPVWAEHFSFCTSLAFHCSQSAYYEGDESLSIFIQQVATICSFTALRVSNDTLIHHQEHIQSVITTILLNNQPDAAVCSQFYSTAR